MNQFLNQHFFQYRLAKMALGYRQSDIARRSLMDKVFRIMYRAGLYRSIYGAYEHKMVSAISFYGFIVAVRS